MHHRVAIALALALLAGPAAEACCAPGAAVGPCAESRGTAAMASGGALHPPVAAAAAHHSAMSSRPCHGDERMTGDCCDQSPAPAPALALSDESRPLLTALAAAGRLTEAPPAPVDPAVPAAPPRTSRLHDLGRYTLFSALLL